jgi:hypothetical protein
VTHYINYFLIDELQIEEVVKWREQTSVTDVWNGTLPVQGVTENGQFHPFLQSDDILIAWDSDLIRPLHLKKRYLSQSIL